MTPKAAAEHVIDVAEVLEQPAGMEASDNLAPSWADRFKVGAGSEVGPRLVMVATSDAL